MSFLLYTLGGIIAAIGVWQVIRAKDAWEAASNLLMGLALVGMGLAERRAAMGRGVGWQPRVGLALVMIAAVLIHFLLV